MGGHGSLTDSGHQTLSRNPDVISLFMALGGPTWRYRENAAGWVQDYSPCTLITPCHVPRAGLQIAIFTKQLTKEDSKLNEIAKLPTQKRDALVKFLDMHTTKTDKEDQILSIAKFQLSKVGEAQ